MGVLEIVLIAALALILLSLFSPGVAAYRAPLGGLWLVLAIVLIVVLVT